MEKHTSGRQAAIDYLREKGGGPLPVKEVTAEAARRAGLKGKTPTATVAAMIYTGAKRGVAFQIPERGMVSLVPDDGERVGEVSQDGESLEGDLAESATAVASEAKPDPKPTPANLGRSRKPVAA